MRRTKQKRMRTVAIRLPEELIRDAKALVSEVKANPDLARSAFRWGNGGYTQIIRLAAERGIRSLRRSCARRTEIRRDQVGAVGSTADPRQREV